MKKLLFLLAAFCMTISFASEMSAETFLQKVRNSAEFNRATYGILEGTATHSRRVNNRKKIEDFPCFMAVIITPGKSITQIIVNNDEGCIVGRVQNESSSLQRIGKKSDIMERIGISPHDLAMSFLDYQLVKELPKETLRMIPCRVFLLKSAENREWVRIYVAEEYFFTLKAEFFKTEAAADSAPDRILEINSFAEDNDLYYAKHLEISGPGWRTDIEFEQAEMNFYDPKQGKKIFRTLQ